MAVNRKRKRACVCVCLCVCLKVALSIKGRREGVVIQGSWYSVRPGVQRHPGDAVFSLFRRQLTLQLLNHYIRLHTPESKHGVLLYFVHVNAYQNNTHTHTLSPARILKEAATCSVVSVSVVSRVMKSTNDWNVTVPLLFGSTTDMIRANSTSPCRHVRTHTHTQRFGVKKGSHQLHFLFFTELRSHADGRIKQHCLNTGSEIRCPSIHLK